MNDKNSSMNNKNIFKYKFVYNQTKLKKIIISSFFYFNILYF